MKALISAPVNELTGYGNDGIELVKSLIRWGIDVYLVPSSVMPPLPREVAAVLTKQIPSHVDLLIAHRCPQELSRPEQAGVLALSTVSMAWSMWEWDSLDNVDHIDKNNCEHSWSVTKNLAKSLQSFDALAAYDEVSHAALSPYHPKSFVLQGGVPVMDFMPRNWSPDATFRFIMLGVLSNRKNPMAAIKAFRELRLEGELENAELILKTTRSTLPPQMEQWCPGLKIISALWPAPKIAQFYQSAHVLLAPSWGEGKNIPACQFAMSGGAVAATNVGGHRQWLSSEYAFPLKYELKEQYEGSHGAEVDMDHLKETMLHLYNNRSDARRKGEIAARTLPSMVSWDRVIERLSDMLPNVVGPRGVEVSALMKSSRRQAEPSDVISKAATDMLSRMGTR